MIILNEIPELISGTDVNEWHRGDAEAMKKMINAEFRKFVRSNPQTVTIDFDGVLTKYRGWKGYQELGEPNEDVLDLVRELMEAKWTVIVSTTRGCLEVNDWLAKNFIKVSYINMNPDLLTQNPGKPASHIYIDDRCIQFKGDVNQLRHNIMNFEVWWEEDENSAEMQVNEPNTIGQIIKKSDDEFDQEVERQIRNLLFIHAKDGHYSMTIGDNSFKIPIKDIPANSDEAELLIEDLVKLCVRYARMEATKK